MQQHMQLCEETALAWEAQEKIHAAGKAHIAKQMLATWPDAQIRPPFT
jgi:hypothetical protein